MRIVMATVTHIMHYITIIVMVIKVPIVPVLTNKNHFIPWIKMN